MSEKDKKKLCWNCEGSVLRHLETCPYCGVYLSPTEQDIGSQKHLTPPYKKNVEEEIPAPIYQSEEDKEIEPSKEFIKAPSEDSSFLYTLLLLIAGTSLSLFGLSLWLFSDQGQLTLSWSDEWAPLFLLVALPLLVFGGKKLARL